MNRNTIFAILMVLTFQVQALDVTNTAGGLADKVTDLNVTTLTVTGTMNANDFYFIADNLHQLTTVDLTGVNILPCYLERERYWQHDFVADELPVGAFGGMDVVNVSLPAGLKSIGKAAFAGCTQLTAVTLPASLDSIADFAFAGCSSLPSVVLPANVEIVGNGAFMRCTSLTSMTVAASSRLKRVDATALMDCPALTTVDLGTAVQSIGERSLAGTGVTQLNWTNSKHLYEIGDWAMVMTPLTAAQLPSSMTNLGEGAFLYDRNLASIGLGGNLNSLSNYALAGTGLTDNVDFSGLSSMGDYALYNVSTLSVVELPATMTWLGAYAMAGMTGMTAISCDATTVPALGENVWYGVNQSSIPLTVPTASIENYKNADQWSKFQFASTWLKGDVNNDGEVNIADVNTLVDIVLGGKFDDATMQRADVNEDGEIGLADVNAVLDIILGPSHLMSAIVDTDDLLRLDDITIRSGEERTFRLVLDNASNYSALQCDITLPQGLTLVNTAVQSNRTGECRAMDASTYRSVVFSMEKLPFDGNDCAVMTITLRADGSLSGESSILLSNVVVADEANSGWHLGDYTARVANSTVIDDLTATADRVWVEGNTLCIDTRHEGMAQVAAINGTVSTCNLVPGTNRQTLDAGFYVVVLNGKSYKIAVK